MLRLTITDLEDHTHLANLSRNRSLSFADQNQARTQAARARGMHEVNAPFSAYNAAHRPAQQRLAWIGGDWGSRDGSPGRAGTSPPAPG